MPRLPAPEDYGLSTPRPARSAVGIDPVVTRPDLATGKVMQDIGLMMQQEAERVDDALAVDALNKLQQHQLDLTYGEQGYSKLQGKQVIDSQMVKSYSEKSKTFEDSLAAGIGSAKAKQKFQLAAADATRGFQGGLLRHSAAQVDKMETDAFVGAQAVAQGKAAAGDVAGATQYMAPLLEAAIARKGYQGDAAALFAQETMGAIYASGINALISGGKAGAARELFEANKGLMTQKQIDHFDKLTKEQTDYDQALTLQAEARAKGLTAVQASDFFREKAKGNKDVIKAADAEHAQYLARKDKDDAETVAPLMLKFMEAGGGFSAQRNILRDPAFLAAAPDVQVKLRTAMRREAEHMQRWGEYQTDLAEKKRLEDPNVLMAFENLARNPDTLQAYTDPHLVGSFYGVLGKTLTNKLIQYKNQVKGEVAKFQIPAENIKANVPLILQEPKGDQEKMQRRQIDHLVAVGLMDWKLANPGKIPDRLEQDKIIAGATREITVPGMIWDSKYKAYELKPMPEDYFTNMKKKLGPRAGELTRERALEFWAREKESR